MTTRRWACARNQDDARNGERAARTSPALAVTHLSWAGAKSAPACAPPKGKRAGPAAGLQGLRALIGLGHG